LQDAPERGWNIPYSRVRPLFGVAGLVRRFLRVVGSERVNAVITRLVLTVRELVRSRPALAALRVRRQRAVGAVMDGAFWPLASCACRLQHQFGSAAWLALTCAALAAMRGRRARLQAVTRRLTAGFRSGA
jgi:hypothetical protein